MISGELELYTVTLTVRVPAVQVVDDHIKLAKSSSGATRPRADHHHHPDPPYFSSPRIQQVSQILS